MGDGPLYRDCFLGWASDVYPILGAVHATANLDYKDASSWGASIESKRRSLSIACVSY